MHKAWYQKFLPNNSKSHTKGRNWCKESFIDRESYQKVANDLLLVAMTNTLFICVGVSDSFFPPIARGLKATKNTNVISPYHRRDV